MIAPQSEVEALLDDVESGKVADVRSLHKRFVSIHSDYYNYEWTWAYNLIKPFYGIDPEMITSEDVIRIVEQWKDSEAAGSIRILSCWRHLTISKSKQPWATSL